MKSNLCVGIIGSGGDGVMILGGLLMETAAKLGYAASRPQTYESQIRGGGSAVKVNIAAGSLIREKDEIDILICFNWKEFLKVESEFLATENTVIICEEHPQAEQTGKIILFPFAQIAKDATGDTRPKNMVLFGLLVNILNLDAGISRKTIEETFAGKKYLPNNLKGFDIGILRPEFHLASNLQLFLSGSGPRIVLHGNKAVALGALRAGCKVFFGYPITPASEIMEIMIPALLKAGGVGLQVEDELSAILTAIGSSQAGSKTLVATSGPGFSLMVEGLGLAVQDEIPLVLVDVQRAGPATGIPTKTEQSDLNLAVYGAHGDAFRVVLAPYDIEGCYRLTIEAFNISEEFQVPVILLSDQLLGQTLYSCEDFKKEHQITNRLQPSANRRDLPYLRYGSFISPMAIPGTPGFTYQTTGLTHNSRGEPAADFETHLRMHVKRWVKLWRLHERRDLIKTFGNPKAKIGVVTWGSSTQAVVSAVFNLGLEEKIKIIVPELLFPLPLLSWENNLQGIKKLLFVELNQFGQFYRIIRGWLDISLPKQTFLYSRSGGKPFSQKELYDWILEVVK